MYKNSLVHYVAKTMVDVLFYSGIICLLLLPFISNSLRSFYGYKDNVLLPFMFILFLSGVSAVYILYNLKQMFKSLLGGNPFISKNVSCFRRMAVACAIISLLYIIKCFFLFTIATVIIVLVFVIGCLFCLTLKDIFKQAIALKEENDLTV